MTKKLLPIFIIVLIIVAAGAFYGGVKYGQNKKTVNADAFPMTGGLNGSGMRVQNGRMNAGFVSGEIIAKDDKIITVKTQNGGSKIVFYSESTEVGKFVSGAPSDLEIGKTVMVNGKSNSDGSITAQSIQLRPQPTSSPAP